MRSALFGCGQDEEEATEGNETEEQRGRIFDDIEKREQREHGGFLCGPGVGVAIAVDEA